MEIADELCKRGYMVRLTNELAELAAVATEWQHNGELRAIVACGGDGTAATVRNHTPLESPLLVVPLGTENLLGRYVKQAPSAAAVTETVEEGVVVEFDLGRARGLGVDASARYFLMMISAGFDAEVVRRLHLRRTGHITRLSYIQPVLETIRSYEYPQLRLYCLDDASQSVEPVSCRWAFGFNLPLYARGWQLAPDAAGTNGRLDVCTFERGSLFHGLRYLWHVMRESHQRLSDARITRGRRFRLEAAAHEVPYQLDGDFAGVLPVEMELLPRKLRMLVMPELARRLGFSLDEVSA
jgi:diacylglycerol kinase family enzyme